MTPIDVETFLIDNLFGLFHLSKTLLRGSLNLIISEIDPLISSILFSLSINLSINFLLLHFLNLSNFV